VRSLCACAKPPLSLVAQMLKQKIWRRGSSYTNKRIKASTHIKKKNISSRLFHIPGATCRMGEIRSHVLRCFPDSEGCDFPQLQTFSLHFPITTQTQRQRQRPNVERNQQSIAQRRLCSGTSQETISAASDWRLHKTVQHNFKYDLCVLELMGY
jgi:hypothetical protein